MLKVILSIILLSLPVTTMAAVGDAKPAEVAKYISAAKPLGKAKLTKFTFKVYDAVLWTNTSRWTPQSTYSLTLHYQLSISAKDIVEASIKEIARIYKPNDKQLNIYRTELNAIFPSVQKGDIISAVHLSNGTTRFYYNSKPIGRITDKEFSERFMGIWFSPETSEPAMREALLAGRSS